MADADAQLLSLCEQVTADVVACGVMLAQVHGYERREHGKLEEVRPYTREEIAGWGAKDPRRVWAAGPGVALYRYNAKGEMEVKWLEGGFWEGTGWRPLNPSGKTHDEQGRLNLPAKIWDEEGKKRPLDEVLTRNSTEITGHHPVVTEPAERPADPHVEVDPSFGKTPEQVQALRDFLRAKLTPGELDLLNKAGVTWHVDTMDTLKKLSRDESYLGIFFSTDRSVHVPGDLSRFKGQYPRPDLPHILLHETGHALDQVLGWPSEHDRSGFYEAIAEHAYGEDDYPRTNPREAFAELFSDLKRDKWQDYAHFFNPVPPAQQQEWKDYLARIEAEGLPAELAVSAEPLCAARYLPDGRLWFGPPGSEPREDAMRGNTWG